MAMKSQEKSLPDIGKVHVLAKNKCQKWAEEYAQYLSKVEFALPDLAKSGLTSETIAEMGCFAANGDKAELLKEVLGFSSMAGQSIAQAVEYYCLPYLHSDGYCRVKLSSPMEDAKYLSPSSHAYELWHIYFLSGEWSKLYKPAVPIIATEGEKKTARLTQEIRAKKIDALAIGFPGVTMWEKCVEWKAMNLRGRKVFIAFDSDFAKNRNVQLEIVKLALWLIQHGSEPVLLSWSVDHKGIDDALIAGMDLASAMKATEASTLVDLLRTMAMVKLQDFVQYLARYGFNKSQAEALYDGHGLVEVYGAKVATVTTMLRQEKKKLSGDETKTTTVDRRPVIRFDDGDLPAAVDAAETLLREHPDKPVFCRNGFLVRLAQIAKPNKRITRDEGATTILAIEKVWLADKLSRLARWEKFYERKQVWQLYGCPEKVAEILLSYGQWKLPRLAGVIFAPTLRTDGSILDQPGYDDATGLYLATDGATFLPVPIAPTLADAHEALARLAYLVHEFPFADGEGNRSVMLSTILTACIRRSLRTAPGHAFSAPQMASGKSLSADLVALIATGRTATKINNPATPEEEHKSLLAVLLAGDNVICLDNVENGLASEALCTILTEESWSNRALGKNQMITVDPAATWIANGNNLAINGDVSTRFVMCRLDAGSEHPEERAFEIEDIRAYTHEHRAELVNAALTILRAYHVAGRPKQAIKQFGRFEDWSGWIRSALIWLGCGDPCATRKEIESTDATRNEISELMVAWEAAFANSPVTAKILVEVSGKNEELANALSAFAGDINGKYNLRSIGKKLTKICSRVQDGKAITKVGIAHQSILWAIRKI
jgi:hypothetical protein